MRTTRGAGGRKVRCATKWSARTKRGYRKSVVVGQFATVCVVRCSGLVQYHATQARTEREARQKETEDPASASWFK